MLGKLIKHELKATGRILLPLYFIVLLLSLFNRLLTNTNVFSGVLGTIRIFMMTAYGISILATLAVTFVVVILRFYKNLMADEGYLMFTLPVKPSQLINSKLIVSFLWNTVGVLVVVASLLIFFGTSDNLRTLGEFIKSLSAELKGVFGDKYILLIAEFVLMILISLIQQVMLIYVSIAVGNLLNGHKVLGSFAAYIAISTIMQIIVTLLLAIWANFAGTSFEDLEAIPQLVFPFSIIVAALFNVVFYFGTNFIFNKKLNLE